jgi:hypothetical protein
MRYSGHTVVGNLIAKMNPLRACLTQYEITVCEALYSLLY